MNKELKDYLHLYLGCDVLISVNGMVNKVVSIVRNPDAEIILGTAILLGVKPILRPLSDMTEEEKFELDQLSPFHPSVSNTNTCDWIILEPIIIEHHAARVSYLLSKHFDLFGLHEAGLCLYKKSKNE